MSKAALPIIGSILNALAGRAAPYDAAKASTYSIEQILDKLGPYSMVQNAISPPLDRPFQVMKDGNPTWVPAVNDFGNMMSFQGTGHPAAAQAQYLKQLLAGADTRMPDDQATKGNLLSDFLTTLGL